jgi:hypothetical protein
MAKDRIERDELASKLMETAASAEDPLRAMAEHRRLVCERRPGVQRSPQTSAPQRPGLATGAGEMGR